MPLFFFKKSCSWFSLSNQPTITCWSVDKIPFDFGASAASEFWAAGSPDETSLSTVGTLCLATTPLFPSSVILSPVLKNSVHPTTPTTAGRPYSLATTAP